MPPSTYIHMYHRDSLRIHSKEIMATHSQVLLTNFLSLLSQLNTICAQYTSRITYINIETTMQWVRVHIMHINLKVITYHSKTVHIGSI